jgi:hypothetical protein
VSNVTFIAAAQGLTISGVKRHYNEPPQSVNTSDLPAAFVTLPSGGRGEPTSVCYDSSKTRSIGIVVLVEAVGQGTNPQNYGKLAALMDAMETAFDTADFGTVFLEYELSVGQQLVGENAYWAITADINGRNA